MKTIATLLTVLTVASCESVTTEQVARAHELYHVLTGADCILILPEK